MTLPSGQISMSQVNSELGRSSTAQLGMSASAVRGTFDVASGQISMSNGRGKSNIKSFSASPSSVNAGSSSTLTATFYANSGSVSPAPGAITSGVGVSVTPSSTTTYTLTAGGSTATTSVTVTAAGYTARRPTTYSGSLLSPVANAYDTSGSSVDTSTSAHYYGYGSATQTFFGFGSGTVTGSVKVRWSATSTASEYIDNWDEWGDPIYAYGFTTVQIYVVNASNLTTTGVTVVSEGNSTGGYITTTFTGTFNLADIVVGVVAQGFDYYSGIGQRVRMYNTVDVSDIVVLY